MRTAWVVPAVLLTLGVAQAADAIRPGKWEFAAQVELPNLPKLPPGITLPPGIKLGAGGIDVTRTSCISQGTAIPAEIKPPGEQHGQCKVTTLENNGGTVRWATDCTQPDSQTVHAEGVAHYAGNTMEATLKTRVSGGKAPPSETTQHITGRYLGPCDGK
ncbi:MAG TPA: DUF3617 family protein [Stellaceae bacterium]|nr:DUF3617 family protein [Stellaceae bacterium]